ncbi:MAG: hypothetical protein J6P98_00810 [Clostridia bacterium]|nr:hypothetical protein [Clostridia bacterium]
MSDNHKIFGMRSNVAYGVCFILPIVAVLALIIDRGMNRENKQFMWEAVLGLVAAILLGALTFFMKYALGWVVYAVMIFFGFLNIFGGATHLPFVSVLAGKIVK